MNYQLLANLEHWLGQQIVGQQDLIHKLLIALLADGHLLVEGAPGLAKTRAIKQMAEGIEGDFNSKKARSAKIPIVNKTIFIFKSRFIK